MALKLKMDGEHAVLQDGKPVYVDDADGKELAFDAEQMRAKISELNTESKQHRLSAKEKAEMLERFGDAKPEEIAAIRKMLDDVGGLDGIAELKKKSGIDVEAIKKSITDAYEAKLAESGKTIEQLTARERQLLIGNGFATSTFLNEKTILPPDVAEAYFGKHFKIEDGNVVAYLGDNKIFSRERPGEVANIEEAMQAIVDAYPMKDRILKAPGGGSGAQESKGGGIKDLSKLTMTELTRRQNEPEVKAYIDKTYGG